MSFSISMNVIINSFLPHTDKRLLYMVIISAGAENWTIPIETKDNPKERTFKPINNWLNNYHSQQSLTKNNFIVFNLITSASHSRKSIKSQRK